jgi:tetratricopeptide (TPR) repeat protein
LEALLKRSPQHEGALVALGQLYRELGHRDQSEEHWRRAIEVNPHFAEYYKNLVVLLAERQAWPELQPYCRTWLELDPGSVEARHIWVECLLETGYPAEAQTEFAKLRALHPPKLAELEAWFAERSK